VGVHPRLKEIAEIIIDNLALNGVYFGVHMGLRSWAVQHALYSQGRETLANVNLYRKAAGLPPIPASENEHRVTKAPAGSSWHNFGLAVDLVEDGDPNKAGIQWSWASTVNYLKIGTESKNFPELEYGGFWKSLKDYPHIEMHGTLTLATARVLLSRGDVQAVWDVVDEETRLRRITGANRN